MRHTLPDIEPLEKVKVGKVWKFKPTDRQVAYIKEWVAKVNISELADKFKVSERTMKTVLKSLNLTKNKTNQQKRNERKSREQKITNAVNRQIEEEKKAEHDPTLFVAQLQTGKDLNGQPLSNEDRIAISMLQLTSESPSANTDFYARVEDRKLMQERQAAIEERRKAEAVAKHKQHLRDEYEAVKKHYQEMGQYFPVLNPLYKNCAEWTVRRREASDAMSLAGMEEPVVTAKGFHTSQQTTASLIWQQISRGEQVAYRQLDTEVDKILRRVGGDDEVTEADKLSAKIEQILAQDN